MSTQSDKKSYSGLIILTLSALLIYLLVMAVNQLNALLDPYTGPGFLPKLIVVAFPFLLAVSLYFALRILFQIRRTPTIRVLIFSGFILFGFSILHRAVRYYYDTEIYLLVGTSFDNQSKINWLGGLAAVLVFVGFVCDYILKRLDHTQNQERKNLANQITEAKKQNVLYQSMIDRFEALKIRINERNKLREDYLYIDEGVLDDYGFKLELKDLFSSTLILGATGSGKTSASGMLISRYLLNQKMGGLILTYKTGEADDWKNRLKAVGYDEEDIVIFSHDTGHQCDFLRYELTRPSVNAGDVTNLVDILKTIGRLAAIGDVSNKSDGGDDSYWETSALNLVRHIIAFIKISTDDVRFDVIGKIMNDLENGVVENLSVEDRRRSVLCLIHSGMTFGKTKKINGELFRAYENAHPTKNVVGRKLTPSEARDFMNSWNELSVIFPSLNDRTRSSILKRIDAMLSPIASGKMADMFASGENTIYPEDTFKGKIIILDLSLQAYGMLGKVAQGVWKYLFQKAVERRSEDDEQPVFLWVDEAHYFLNELDQRFLTTVRSKKCVTVFLTQNISNFITAIDENPTKAMLGNFKTQIFHRNDSYDTNEYSADLIGKYWHRQINEGVSDSTSESSSTSRSESTSLGTSTSHASSITDSKAYGRTGGTIGHLFMPPEVTNYYSSRATLSLTTGTSESLTTGSSETTGTSTSHSESYSNSKSTSSGFTEIREYLIQPDEFKRLNDNYGDIEGMVYFAGKDLGNNKPYKRALFDPLDRSDEEQLEIASKELEKQGLVVATSKVECEELTLKIETNEKKIVELEQQRQKIPALYDQLQI